MPKLREAREGDRLGLAIMDIRLAGRTDGVHAAIELFTKLGIRSIFASAHADVQSRERASADALIHLLRQHLELKVITRLGRLPFARGERERTQAGITKLERSIGQLGHPPHPEPCLFFPLNSASDASFELTRLLLDPAQPRRGRPCFFAA